MAPRLTCMKNVARLSLGRIGVRRLILLLSLPLLPLACQYSFASANRRSRILTSLPALANFSASLVNRCRAPPYLHGVADDDMDAFHRWLNEFHTGNVKSRLSITTESNVALTFALGSGDLFPFQSLQSFTGHCDVDFEGDILAHRDWWVTARSHFIYEHLPVIAWLRYGIQQTRFWVHNNGPVIMLDNIHSNREFLKYFDSDFEKRVLWVDEGDTVCVRGNVFHPVYTLDSTNDSDPSSSHILRASWTIGSLSGRPPGGRIFTEPGLVVLARRWIAERVPHLVVSPPEPTVIYYVRDASAGAGNGRMMDKENDSEIQKELQSKLKACGRPEKMVVFTGYNAYGKEMSQKEQFLLLHSATMFVGPHGGAFAGILFMKPYHMPPERLEHGLECSSRPQVVEFIAGPRSGRVQWPFASYFGLYLGAHWVEYHLIQFHSNSTSAVTHLDMDEWERVIQACFSGSRCPS